MRDIDIIIYDFDGVIADTAGDIAGAVQATQEHYGKPIMDIPTVISFVGFGAKYLIARCLPDMSEPELEEALRWYKAYYQAHSCVTTVLYPTVSETLHAFAAAKIAQCVVSNKPEPITRKLVAELGVADCFDLILGPESLSKMKPDPEGLLRCLRETGRSRGVMIGDSYTDILAGRSANMKTCGVLYGIGDREKLLNAGADYYIKTLSELLPLTGRTFLK